MLIEPSECKIPEMGQGRAILDSIRKCIKIKFMILYVNEIKWPFQGVWETIRIN